MSTYDFNIDTEKCRHDDATLTESGNARSEQLLVMPTVELLSGSECQRLNWFLDMKYQTFNHVRLR